MKFLPIFSLRLHKCVQIPAANLNTWWLAYVVNAQGTLLFIYFSPSPRATADAEKFPLHLPLQTGFFFLFSGLLSSSLFYLSGALDDVSHAKHGHDKSKEPAHNLLVHFPRMTFAFNWLIYSLDSCSVFFLDSKDFSSS